MSYIDIKTESADFRVILASHLVPTNKSLVPNGCSGVLLEGNIPDTDQQLPYLFIEGSSEVNAAIRHQYGGIIHEAKSRQLSIATAISPLVQGGSDRVKKLLGKYTGPYSAAEAVMSADCLQEEHPLVQALLAEVDKNLCANPKSPLPYVDVLIAQTAHSFAQLQREQGLKPFLGLVVGAFHIGVINTLRMGKAERRNLISSKLDKKVFNAEMLGDVFYIEYDTVTNKYLRKFLKGGIE